MQQVVIRLAYAVMVRPRQHRIAHRTHGPSCPLILLMLHAVSRYS
jgi:hypothetical protein